jgi:hypothetical protein
MYEDAEAQIERILKLVEKCPQQLQEKCFEVLLGGYAKSQFAAGQTRKTELSPRREEAAPARSEAAAETEIPEQIRGRFNTMAKRIGVEPDKLASLFDFSTDPFTYHALQVPGGSKAEKTRNVALLVSAKNYLTTGQWSGDWKEFRAMSVDQNCYDRTNITTHMKHEHIKAASPDGGISLSPAGQKAAEKLLKNLAAPTE